MGETRLMRVLLTSTSGQGHVQPLLTLARAFGAVGVETLFVVPKSGAASVSNAGLAVTPSDDPDSNDSDSLWSRFSTLPRAEASALVERDWFAGLCFDAMLPTVERTVAEWRPDLLVREACEYASAVVADRASIPQVQHGISTAGAEALVLATFAKEKLDGCAAGLTERVEASPYVTRFPESLDASPYRITLRYREGDDHVPTALPNWWSGSKSPLVYVTLGTVATRTSDGVEILRAAIDALSGLDARVLVTTGTVMEPEALGPLGREVHVETWVDQRDVMAEASLVVCHGGSGTTFGSLAAGTPLVMLPIFADQPTNARLVERAGAGLAIVSDSQSASENSFFLRGQRDALRRSVETVLSVPRYREAAERISSEMMTMPTATELCEQLTTAPFGRES